MSYACMLHIPAPTDPIKAVSEKGSGHSPLEGTANPFPPEQQIVSGMTYSHLRWLGELQGTGPSTVPHRALLLTEASLHST